jgi:hypothetical protein
MAANVTDKISPAKSEIMSKNKVVPIPSKIAE